DVLLLGSDSLYLDQSAVREVEKILEDEGARLSDEFVILVSGSLNAVEEVAAATERSDVAFVTIPMNRLPSLAPYGEDTLTSLLQARVYSRALYQPTGAITDVQRFFGRQALINELEAALRLKGHVGLFGLRKMGKTSLLYRLLEKLRAHKTILAAHV